MAFPPQRGEQSNMHGRSGIAATPPSAYDTVPIYVGERRDPMPCPSGGTAIAAGVLAIIGAAWALAAGLLNSAAIAIPGDQPGPFQDMGWLVWLQIGACGIELVTLGLGAILLLRRRGAGRWLIAIGCLADIGQGSIIVAWLMSGGTIGSLHLSGSLEVGGGAIGGLVVLSPAVLTLVLVLVPATRRWCLVGRHTRTR